MVRMYEEVKCNNVTTLNIMIVTFSLSNTPFISIYNHLVVTT